METRARTKYVYVLPAKSITSIRREVPSLQIVQNKGQNMDLIKKREKGREEKIKRNPTAKIRSSSL